MSRRGCWRITCLFVLLILGWAAIGADKPPDDATKKEATPQPTPQPAAEPTAEELRQRVLALASQGNLTDELIALFKDYVMTRAREQLSKDVPADFWTWVSANRTIRDGLVVALHPAYSPQVVKRLAELRAKFGENVNTHAHLALAFAVVFGRAGDREPWGPYGGYLRKDREAPTMEQSFAYYLKCEKLMRFPLRDTPWFLLAFVADNETPIKERIWALDTYAGRTDTRLAAIYSDVPYDWDKLRGKAKIGDLPRTLANLKEFGGVCVDQAYYASRIYKSFAIPSLAPGGEGKEGGHAWVAWICRTGKSYDMVDRNRFWTDHYYTGHDFSPLERKRVLDRDVQLLAIAVGKSYDQYVNALLGCEIYELFTPEERKGKTELLKEAAERNPFCAEPWRLLADAAATGLLSAKEGEEVFDTILKALAPCPDLTFEVLEKVLSPRLQTVADAKKEEIEKNLQILGRAFQVYDQSDRPDLAVKLCLLQGTYLEGAGQQKPALLLYVSTSEKYARKHFGFREAFDRALRLMDTPQGLGKRLAFCEMMVKEVPKRRGFMDRKLNEYNPSWVYVVRAYIRTLQDAGQDRLAADWEAKLKKHD